MLLGKLIFMLVIDYIILLTNNSKMKQHIVMKFSKNVDICPRKRLVIFICL